MIYGTLCGPPKILGVPPAVHLDHVENHCPRRITIHVKLMSLPDFINVLRLIRTELPATFFIKTPWFYTKSKIRTIY